MATHITIDDITPRIQYLGDGSQTVFTYPFPIFEDGDLEVYEDASLKTITTHYSVSGAGDSTGGSVTFVAAPASNVTVTLRRNLPIKRTTDFQEGGDFRARTINDELDRLTAGLQQVEAEETRALQLSPTDTATSVELPGIDVRKGKVLSFDDATGDPEATVTKDDILNVTANVAAAAASAAAASTSQTNAGTSETNAATSSTEAATSAVLASDWAKKTGSTVDGSDYSAKKHAVDAAASAAAAAAVSDLGVEASRPPANWMLGDGAYLSLADLRQLIHPAGTYGSTAAASAPVGGLLCYGQAISRATYAALFDAIGTTYGVGDGSTTFNLPDLRGRVLAGKDDMGTVAASRLSSASAAALDGTVLGQTGGVEEHQLTIAELAAHTHTWSGPAGRTHPTGPDTNPDWFGTASDNTGSTGGDAAHTNVQPTIIVNIFIWT